MTTCIRDETPRPQWSPADVRLSDRNMERLKDAVCTTLTATVQRLGPMPDSDGALVRAVLAGTDESSLLGLGVALDACRTGGSWQGFSATLNDMGVHT